MQAAAEASPDPKKALAVNYRELVARLSRSEGDDFLARLAEGDPSVGLALRKRLSNMLLQERPQAVKPRTIQQLLERAEQLEQAEAKRQAEAARRKHIAEMKALAAREAQTWQQVDTLLETGRKIASVYDEATSLLEKLKQLAEFQDTQGVMKPGIPSITQSDIERWVGSASFHKGQTYYRQGMIFKAHVKGQTIQARCQRIALCVPFRMNSTGPGCKQKGTACRKIHYKFLATFSGTSYKNKTRQLRGARMACFAKQCSTARRSFLRFTQEPQLDSFESSYYTPALERGLF